jgi:hypothetical protein
MFLMLICENIGLCENIGHRALSEIASDSIRWCKLSVANEMCHNGTIDALKTPDTRNLCHLCKDSLHFRRPRDTRSSRTTVSLGASKY